MDDPSFTAGPLSGLYAPTRAVRAARMSSTWPQTRPSGGTKGTGGGWAGGNCGLFKGGPVTMRVLRVSGPVETKYLYVCGVYMYACDAYANGERAGKHSKGCASNLAFDGALLFGLEHSGAEFYVLFFWNLYLKSKC